MGNKQGKDGGTSDEVGQPRNRKVSSASEESANTLHSDDTPANTSQPPPVKEIPFVSEIGGGKGWPSDVNVVLYHHAKGLVIAGTENGTIYAYGDGFQYMLPAFQEENDITHIVSLYEERILVTYSDNSMAVLMLPSLTVVDRLPASWLAKAFGDITVVYVDERNGRNFAYVGTTDGFTRVIEVLPTFRLCDYIISPADANVPKTSAVSDIQLSPKDERYLVVAFDGAEASEGAVVVFDLVKRKPYRHYLTAAVTTIAFNDTGDMLFAGTRSGDVLSLGLEKQHSGAIWNSSVERNEDDTDEVITIRKMRWLFPQHPSTQGCLFVLLGAIGADSDLLKSVIVVLTISGNGSYRSRVAYLCCLDVQQILSIPPLSMEEVVGFRIVPTWEKNNAADALKEDCDVAPVPGLLFLTQREDHIGNMIRQLKLLRCPTTPIREWSLETGLLPEPRNAKEVLAGETPVTYITGMMPGSVANTLVGTFEEMVKSHSAPHAPPQITPTAATSNVPDTPSKKRNSRRLSTRDFFARVSVSDLEIYVTQQETWELVLASGERTEDEGLLDIVLLGYADGSVVAWGVSLPAIDEGGGRGNQWVPLTVLKVASAEISLITHSTRHLLCGDDQGNIVCWEVLATDNYTLKTTDLREVLRSAVDGRVTSGAVIDGSGCIFVGTRDGKLFASSDMTQGELQPLVYDAIDEECAVNYMYQGPYWRDGYVAALYICYTSGFVAVINALTKELLAYSNGNVLKHAKSEGDEEDDISAPVVFSCIVDSNFNVLTKIPDGEVITASAQTSFSECADSQTGSLPNTPDKPEATDFNKAATVTSFVGKLKRSSLSKSESSSGRPLDKKTSGRMSTGSMPPVFPQDVPRYFMLVRDKYVYTYDLSKFGTCKPGTNMFTLCFPGSATAKSLSDESIVAAQLTTYVEDATRFWSSPISCLAAIDKSGYMQFLMLRDMSPVSCLSLLEKVLPYQQYLEGGVILPNGNSYLRHNQHMIFSACPSNREYVQVAPLPSRGSTAYVPPIPIQQMRFGHDGGKTQTKGKRRSIMSLSAPADLDKVFNKTWDQRQKDELFGISEDAEEEDDEDVSSAHVSNAHTSSHAVKANLDEVRDAYEERGERIRRLNKKMENFKENAEKYKKDSAAHKEKMKAKAARWGFF